jgi:hypothetical protein
MGSCRAGWCLGIAWLTFFLPIQPTRGQATPQNDTDDNPPAAGGRYEQVVRADEPVVWWRFEDSRGAGISPEGDLVPCKKHGNIVFGAAGPAAPQFPLFSQTNRAVTLTPPAYLAYADPGAGSWFDFGPGDSLTIEAWVRPESVAEGRQVYVIGKGRTGNAGFPKDNQNWALRLVGKQGRCHLSFLFRDRDNRPGQQDDWHRWTSRASLAAGQWHHVAVVYTFGQAGSIQGYIDGQPTDGSWDYGGASDEAPVVDDDEVWIGGASGGAVANAYAGSLDEVAIYRRALSAHRIAVHYAVARPEPYVTREPIPLNSVLVEILEGIPDEWSWDFVAPAPSERYRQSVLATVELPRKYTRHGVIDDRSSPLVVWMHSRLVLPEGKYRLLVRSRSASRLYVDDALVLENPFQSNKTDGHNPYQAPRSEISPRLRAVQPGDREQVVEVALAAGEHRLRWELFVGGKKRRPELGEAAVAMAPAGSDDFWVIGWPQQPEALRQAVVAAAGQPVQPPSLVAALAAFPLTDAGWSAWEERERAALVQMNRERRAAASAAYARYWEARHDWARQVIADKPPPEHASIDGFVDAHLASQGLAPAPLADDATLVRRLWLDLVGTIPPAAEVAAFLADERPDKRQRLVERLLADDGWADHWVGYWQDVLAENPNIVNPTLNNTGPFRFWLHEALLDNKPLDRMVTELVLMEGSLRYGGTAGFSMATENDAPLAAKAQNLALAFLAMDLRCARCHDAPHHPFTQRDLFELAAMLGRGEQTLPKSSTIPGDEQAHRSLLVSVTLRPGEKIAPRWPLGQHFAGPPPTQWLEHPDDPREQLALWITAPQNPRFAKVMVNRLWQRYFGRGLVEPVDDWETATPTHPALLEWLADELIRGGYDAKHIIRLICNSRAYQRQATSDPDRARHLAAPLRRRMTAEQLFDSLLVASGKQAHVEEMNIDVDGSRLETVSINLGRPTRAWRFATLGNERDRPSLSLPAAQTAVTLLETFGWRSSRQDPQSYREQEPTVLQPAILANGAFAKRMWEFSEDSAFVALALKAETPADFLQQVYLRVLSRPPTPAERDALLPVLAEGFSDRATGLPPGPRPTWPARDGVSWSNHLQPRSNEIRLARQKEVERGDPPTQRLTEAWRQRAEDVVWALINSPEFVWIP